MKKVLLSLAVVVALACVPAGSGATGPQCGDVITTSVVLNADLHCSGSGLSIPATADVTLNLNGHALIGSGSGAGLTITPTGNPRVVVKNGSIRGFDVGIRIDAGTVFMAGGSALLERLTLRDNGYGFLGGPNGFAGPDTTLIRSTIVHNSLDGVNVAFLNTFRMSDDRVSENGGIGINANEDSLKLLQDSFIARNGGAGASFINDGAVITGNTFLANGGTGLFISDTLLCAPGPGTVVTNNVANRNGNGGMIAIADVLPLPPDCDPPPGITSSGNHAEGNAVFQCIVIVCNKSR